MRKRPIANRRPGNRSKPSVEHCKLRRQRSQHGKSACLKVVHDFLRMLYIALLIEVALHEPLHAGHARRIAAKDLQIDRRKMVVGIRLKLP